MTNRSNLYLVTFITLARFPLVVLFFTGALFFVKYQATWLFFTSFSLLLLAALTDLFDGYLARKLNVVTKFGAHADPLMDKFFYLSTLPLLVYVASKNQHNTHAVFLLVMTVFFLSRDQWVTFLRSIGSMYNISGGANWSGKLRTAINFPMICLIYFVEEAPTPPIISNWIMYTTEAIAILSNLVSLYVYTRHYWPYLVKSTNQ
jgi:CDP-diacylglycerol--glycerol-3-phosphate 3-phosphatidyltransferase